MRRDHVMDQDETRVDDFGEEIETSDDELSKDEQDTILRQHAEDDRTTFHESLTSDDEDESDSDSDDEMLVDDSL
jgi:hypothetical protein